LEQSATASTATTTSLSVASDSSTSLSQELTSYVPAMQSRLDLWRIVGIVGVAGAGVEFVVIILSIIF